ncbi:ABC transporter substrate-binding protein [Parablautia muri]|uniref:ABC transporter substrate-binding protein n=1 Tax=Parablautia muri TaxID=2320879 RepID=A0A9X5BHM9_9FIRM|nr:ABC transporter substrate-binding protein [Parablautia muri]NBJ93978.1 ABC transporter substrate-binding protein [Parablautia muri]
MMPVQPKMHLGGGTEENNSSDTSGGAVSSGEPKSGGVLRYASASTVSTPGYTPECSNNASLIFLTTAYEFLVTYAEDGSLAPKLATEWETDADEPSITWTLREGVTFADGMPFNAEAVKANIEEYQKSERNETNNIASCEVIDDTHIKMVLNSWNSSTLEAVGFFVYYMSPEALKDVDSLRNSSCGTGPFQVTDFSPGVSVKYAKNENYWQEGKPYLDGVEIYTVDEPTTRSSAFQAGEYDLLEMDDMTIANELAMSGNYETEDNITGQGFVSTGIIPNSAEDGPFADPLVRRALCYAIDVEAVVEAFGYGMWIELDQWATPDAVTYNNDINHFTYDPDKARALLAEAGYPDGFTTTFTTNPGHKDEFTAIANMLEEVGIHCEMNLVDESAQVNLYSTGTWTGIMGHFAAISPDLGLYMGRHLDYNGAFYAPGIQHPDEAMDLLEAIRTAPTEEEKHKLEHDMQKLMYDAEEGLAIFGRPLYTSKTAVFKYDYVKDDNRGVYHNDTWTLADCWLDK